MDTRDMKNPENIIVDCDAGTDDALALIMLLAAHKIKKINIKAVTCVHGNTDVNNVVKNVFRTLQICGITDVPVYQGAHLPLLNVLHNSGIVLASSIQYHGTDGFGDVYTDNPDISNLQDLNAMFALNNIVAHDPGNISIVCLGPLTNIAVTIKMFPEFVSQVKQFFVMGGNSTGQGNITSQAEFNFYVDPESVHILLNSNDKPLWLLPWETCLKSRITHEWRRDVLGKINALCVHMLNKIEHGRDARVNKHFAFYVSCDAFLAGIVLNRDMAKNVTPWHANIELHGQWTRGQIVLDYLLSHKPNINLIHDFDSELFKETLMRAMDVFKTASDYTICNDDQS